MKNKGFTLVELLGVLIVLSIIMTILIVSVNGILSDSENKLSDVQKKKIEEAAEVYYLDRGMNENATCVNISYLISQGYLNGNEIIDPETKENLTGSVSITYVSNHYNYQYQTNACE